MTKKQKSAKRAFISSVLSVILCFTMLVGTTFAWYNDSVTSDRNKIVAGSLEMVLEHYVPATETEEAKWETVSGTTKVFADSLTFEPGAAQVAYVRVKNAGDLAFKYSLAIAVDEKTIGKNKAGEDLDLTNYLKFGAVQMANDTFAPYPTTDAGRATAIAAAGTNNISSSDFVTAAVLQKETTSDVYALIIYMPSSLGNEVNPDPEHKPDITFGLNALATQATIENDSFSDQYDANATLNFAPVTTAVAFNDALSAGRSASLENDVALGNTYQVSANQDVVIDGNGNTLSSINGTRVINIDTAPGASVTLNDVKVDAGDKERGVSLYNSENAEVSVNSSELDADYYTVNVASNCPNAELNVENSKITGWCAFQTWSANVTINVNNSTLIGLNDKTYNADGWNNFSTIVINEPAQGSVITVRNSRIEANQTTGNKQTFVSFRAASGATVIFENCTFWKDGVQITDMQEIVNNIQFTSQAAIDNSHLTINGVTIL
ncbi:MAG: hypothetical protein J5441_00760 [Clostridia bacterium]|nr:hypothetical protein [Clostridia bacterium]